MLVIEWGGKLRLRLLIRLVLGRAGNVLVPKDACNLHVGADHEDKGGDEEHGDDAQLIDGSVLLLPSVRAVGKVVRVDAKARVGASVQNNGVWKDDQQ